MSERAMERFKETKRFDLPALEEEILAWWKAENVFERSVAQNEGRPAFSFYEGPPTANGRPGIHHVMARTIKDTFCRYKTMKGFKVLRKAGWDTHGLPVEIEVEKELGLSGRHQVEEYGIAAYNAACRESVLRYKGLWDDLTTRMGYWVDLDDPYITFKSHYIESVWWLLKRMWEKDLLYKGYKIQWYSPGSGTVLSSHEVSLGYKEVQDPSVYVRFRALDGDVDFLAWTTTPWTLISNVALAVGPEIDYVTVRLTGDPAARPLVLARTRLSVLREEYEVVAECKGSDLVGRRYEPLYPYFRTEVSEPAAWTVVPAYYVTTEDGTGIVHTAPAFGADDYDTAQRVGLPVVNPIAADGYFTDRAPIVAGLWFKDADKVVARDLRDRGLLFRQETYLHNYPHDWRKGTPLMSYPVDSWFIRTTALKDRLIELNETINWQPEGIGTGRFGDWLRNNVDWALSRRRYWGTPLPIWQSDVPGSTVLEMIGSIAELREKCPGQLPESDDDVDLHRPFVDGLTWPSPDGGTMRRVEDLIDVWFDSGAMPFAQWHYPFENKEAFEASFPADFIAEGVDQTRGWFYTLHAIATLVMDDVAYRNVVVNGLVLDENGEKMSKTKGNAVDPFATIKEHGADVVRWYMMANTPPWENVKFSDRGLQESQRRFFSTLANVYSFFATYANIDGFRHAEAPVPLAERPEMDRWILSRLASTAAAVDEALAVYHPTRAARAVEAFVDELSNWHIRRSRRRFWTSKDGAEGGDERDKLSAYQTVYQSLDVVSRLMSPIAPFFSEWLYRALNEVTRLNTADSVHLTRFPDSSSVGPVDLALEHRMDLARTISSIVLALRNASSINVRQPLARILVVTGVGVERNVVESVAEIIRDEVNVKEVEFVEGSSGVVNRQAKANFKVLGRRMGKLMKPVADAVRTLDAASIDAYIASGSLEIVVEGQPVVLGPDEIEITSEGIAGWLVGQEAGVTVALDTARTPALVAEGFARETVNRIQNMRKAAGFEVTDRIEVEFSATALLSAALVRHEAWVRNETLAVALTPVSHPSGERVDEFELDDERFTLAVRRTAG